VLATASEMIAVTFDASAYMDRKLSSISALRSAFGVTPETMNEASPMLRAFRPVLEREVFLLAGARGPVPRWPMPDFFDGLEAAELTPSSRSFS
jgi:hypothetical protein